MGIEEVLEKAKIKFPRVLDIEEAKRLIDFIASKSGGDIERLASEDLIKKNWCYSLVGTIYLNGIYQDFRLISKEGQDSITTSLEFELISGLKEYNPETIAVWDTVREAVEEYLTQKR